MKKTGIMIAASFTTGIIFGAAKPMGNFVSPAFKKGEHEIMKMYHFIIKFMMKRKEYIEDLIAEARMKNK